MEIDRQEFLKLLQLVSPGLASKDVVEQSCSFVFHDGKIHTYNDEVYCSIPTELPIQGAVPSAGLLAILGKLKSDKLDVVQAESELLLKGSGSRTGVVVDAQVLLPIESVEKPGKWKSLPSKFAEAISLARTCAATDETRFDLSCVHIHPDYVEACDNSQILRYALKLGLKSDWLVRARSIKQLAQLGVTQVSQGKTWAHFRNEENGLVYAVRRYEEQYPDLSDFLDVSGDHLVFPGGLREKVEEASIFSSDGSNESDHVLVDLRAGKLRIKGTGSLGWHMSVTTVGYSGDPLRFMCPPKLLCEFSDRANECVVSRDRLLVEGAGYRWVGSLVAVGE